jgi:hypothetical protein
LHEPPGIGFVPGVTWLLAVALMATSCSPTLRAGKEARPVGAESSRIYQRADLSFAEAAFFKPAEDHPEDLTFKLAPLILQEVKPAASAQAGAAAIDRLGSLEVNSSERQPTVYYAPSTAIFGDTPHVQLIYLWCYADVPPGTSPSALAAQGVRITLNSSGEPVIWEVLADGSETEIFFVARSLEEAAKAEHGQPFPGRRFSTERALNALPKTVVARVIEDGPTPMGPIVYLAAGSHDIATLLCRCMPAQARRLTATSSYVLKPFPETSSTAVALRTRLTSFRPPGFWPGEAEATPRAQRCLRLPSRF